MASLTHPAGQSRRQEASGWLPSGRRPCAYSTRRAEPLWAAPLNYTPSFDYAQDCILPESVLEVTMAAQEKHRVVDPYLHYISATAIIHKDGKYLITKRSPQKKVFPNKWTVPGGKLDAGDYLNIPKTTPSAWYGAVAMALKREVKEEVNLEIKNTRYLIDMTLLGTDNIPTVVLSFSADYESGEVVLDKDAVKYAWVTAKEAEQYDLIEGIYEEIVMADKLIKGADPETVKFEPRQYK